MSNQLRCLLCLGLAGFLGVAGCSGSGPGAGSVAQNTAPKVDPDRPAGPNAGIPVDQFGPIMEAHYRGLGFMERFAYPGATVAFREVHRLAPEWIPGSINLAIALIYGGGTMPEVASHATDEKALDLLDQVIARDPANLHAHFCRGVVLDRLGLLGRAHKDFQAVVDKDPNDAHAWYMLGSTLRVAERDEFADADVAKNREELTARASELTKIECFQRALECNPYLTTARYKLAMVYRLAGNQEQSKKQLRLFGELIEESMGYRPAEESGMSYYGEMGRYALVINPSVESRSPAIPRQLVRFDSPAQLKIRLADKDHWASEADFTGKLAVIGRARARFGCPIVAFDADGDGRTDLFLPSAVVGASGVRDALLLNRGDGAFEDMTLRWGVPMERASLGAAAGDFDADGRVDLFLTGVGDNRLFHNEGGSGFKDVTKAAGLSNPSALSLTARWLDLDQDGDLDLYVVNYTGLDHLDLAFTDRTPPGFSNAAYRNDGKASPIPGLTPGDMAPPAVAQEHIKASSGLSIAFSPWMGSQAILGGTSPHTGLAVLDLDDDRDLDLVLSAEGTELQAMLNDRIGRYHPVTFKGIEHSAGSGGLLVIDLDQDGRSDLVTLGPGGQVGCWRSQMRRIGGDVTLAFERWPNEVGLWRAALAADLDLDGKPDLLGLPGSKASLIPEAALNDGQRFSASTLLNGAGDLSSDRLQGIAMVDLVGDPLPDLVLIKDGKGPHMAHNRGNGRHWLSLRLSGRWASWGRLRTNPHGIGARVALQGPGLNVRFDAATTETGLAQSVVPITLGLGDTGSVAVMQLRWPDGASQTEINIPGNQLLAMAETTHRISTCPILFTWDGQRYQCVSDFLAGGGLGYFLDSGVYCEPDRDESVAIRDDQLHSSEGAYRLVIAEPMDETAYLDRLVLDVVDRPPGVAAAPDERFTTGGRRPTGELIAWKERVQPVRATDLAGNDVTDVLRAWDRRTADGFKRLEGWNGYAEEHGIVLNFSDRLSRFGPKNPLFLCLAGWVEYPFSQTNYAASTAGVALRLPVLERLQDDGTWKLIEANPGCPAGLPRLTTLDLSGKLTGPRCVLRLRTNLECYWDQAFVAIRQSAPGIRVTSLPVHRAVLDYRGYLLETSPDGRMPALYDYDAVVPKPLARMTGRFTRYGDVTPLLQQDDDHLCLVGPGDEVRVEFEAQKVPSLPKGWTRGFVLRAVGYCKDADLFTATGDTVGPLPWRGMSTYPFGPEGERSADQAYLDYLRAYQTRRVPR